MTLITSLEQAGEGSRELDALVWCAVTGETPSFPFGEPDREGPWIVYGNGMWEALKPYTTSLDAALALAERLNLNGPCELHRSGVKEWGFHFEGIDTAYSPTPALSVCIAILRAMEGRK